MNGSSQDIRLTGTSFAVLGLVDLLGEATPYDLKAALEASVANFWPVQHTTFYAEPARLAKAGYLTVEQEEGGRRRKLYRGTERGRQALAEWIASPDFKPPQQRDEQMLKLFLGADPEPMVEPRIEWHRSKLAELEGYLAAVRETGKAEGFGSEGTERALVSGVFYHRTLLEAIERYGREGQQAFEAGADKE
jgi:PadR family transcriptional regulator, regulatory protein AphA